MRVDIYMLKSAENTVFSQDFKTQPPKYIIFNGRFGIHRISTQEEWHNAYPDQWIL